MKKNLILFLIIAVKSYGQTPNLNELLSGKELATNKINRIYDLDVFRYYGLSDYNTELQRQVYKNSEDYAQKLSELKGLKLDLNNRMSYIVLSNEHFYNNNYNLKDKGFDIHINNYLGITNSFYLPHDQENENMYGVEEEPIIVLKPLTVKKIPITPMRNSKSNHFEEVLFIPGDANFGLEIEKNSDDTEIYLFFKPKRKEAFTYRSFALNTNSWSEKKAILMVSDETRLVVANKKTKEIYFDKTYSQPKTK